MGIFDSYSKRQRRARGEVPDVYVYQLPPELRVQIVHIIRDAFGTDHYSAENAKELYEFVYNTICRERGVFELVKPEYREPAADKLFRYFLNEADTERALDVVELCFKMMISWIKEKTDYRRNTDREMSPDDAVAELNDRFKEQGVGYQFESQEIIRVDSEFLHAEAIKPALSVLRGDEFQGANEEFLRAHEHYRHGRHKECLADCLSAFESTMKSICKLRGWTIAADATAKALLDACFQNGLLPPFLESKFSALRGLLESGLPTIRNKRGGHGQGSESQPVPEYLARYALNLTASAIVFLTDVNASTS